MDMSQDVNAVSAIEKFRENGPAPFLAACAQVILGDFDDPVVYRAIMLIYLQFTDTHADARTRGSILWSDLTDDLRENLKKALARGLTLPDEESRVASAQLLGTLSKFDPLRDVMENLNDVLLDTESRFSIEMQISCLAAFRHILCNRGLLTRPEYPCDIRDNVVTAAVNILNGQDCDVLLKIEATDVLVQAIRIFTRLANSDESAGLILCAIDVNWSIENDKLHDSLYILLRSVFERSYPFLPDDAIRWIAGSTLSDFTSHVPMLPITFWRHTAKFEYTTFECGFPIAASHTNRYVVASFCADLVTLLLKQLGSLNEESEDDSDFWSGSISHKAYSVLSLVARLNPDSTCQCISEFLTQIGNFALSTQVALFSLAKAAFPCVTALLQAAMPHFLIPALGHDDTPIRELSARAIGAILRHQPLFPDAASEVSYVTELATYLTGNPLLFPIVSQYALKFEPGLPDSPLGASFHAIATALLPLLVTDDSAIAALECVIRHTPKSGFPSLLEFAACVAPNCDSGRLLSLLSACFATLGPLDPATVREYWELAWSLVGAAPGESMTLIGALSNCCPEFAAGHRDALVSLICERIADAPETVVLVGELARAGLLLIGIDGLTHLVGICREDLAGHWPITVMFAIGDVLRVAGDMTAECWEGIVRIVAAIGEKEYCTEDKGTMEKVCVDLEGMLWLAGGLIVAGAGCEEFLVDARPALFAGLRKRGFRAAVMFGKGLRLMLLTFLEDARCGEKPIKVFRAVVNSMEIRACLMFLAKSGKTARERARAARLLEQ
jgi:hypothetical protein